MDECFVLAHILSYDTALLIDLDDLFSKLETWNFLSSASGYIDLGCSGTTKWRYSDDVCIRQIIVLPQKLGLYQLREEQKYRVSESICSKLTKQGELSNILEL